MAQKQTVENYFARAKVFEALKNPTEATDDVRRATELAPAGVFDVLAQAESKRKIRELPKRLPCGDGGRSKHAAACMGATGLASIVRPLAK